MNVTSSFMCNRPGLLVENDSMKFFVTNEIGGRILWYGTKDFNILYEGDDSLFNTKFDYSYINSQEGLRQKRLDQGWINLGGYKTWLAPQSRWQGPPYVELDSATYQMASYEQGNGDIFIKQTSPICREINAIIEREIVINENFTVKIKHTLLKLDDIFESWGIWDVTEVKKSCDTFVENGKIIKYEEFGLQSDVDDFVEFDDSKMALKINSLANEKRGFKVYLFADTNKVVTRFENGIEYTKKFETNVNKRYAHNSNIEVYSDFTKNYSEIEVHSPLFDFDKDNKKAQFTITWDLKLP